MPRVRKMKFRFKMPNKETMVSWGICALAVISVVLAGLVYSKVQPEGYAPSSRHNRRARTPPPTDNTTVTPPSSWVQSCQQAFTNAGYDPSCQTDPSGGKDPAHCADYPVYYCNGNRLDSTGDPNGGGSCYKYKDDPSWPQAVAYSPSDCTNPKKAVTGSLCGGVGADNCKSYCGGMPIKPASPNPWGYTGMCSDTGVYTPPAVTDPPPPGELSHPPSKFSYCGGPGGEKCTDVCMVSVPHTDSDGKVTYTMVPTRVYPADVNDWGFTGICEKSTGGGIPSRPGTLCSTSGSEQCEKICGTNPISTAPNNPWGYDRICDLPNAPAPTGVTLVGQPGVSKFSYCGGPNAKNCNTICGASTVYPAPANEWGATGVCEVPADVTAVKSVMKSTESTNNTNTIMNSLKIILLVLALIVCVFLLIKYIKNEDNEEGESDE
jgi:hypothetical protein